MNVADVCFLKSGRHREGEGAAGLPTVRPGEGGGGTQPAGLLGRCGEALLPAPAAAGPQLRSCGPSGCPPPLSLFSLCGFPPLRVSLPAVLLQYVLIHL